MKKEILIGFLVAIFATFCGLFLYTQYISELDFISTLKKVREGRALGSVIAMAAIPNLFVFFVFLKKKQDYRARGVLIASILITFITFALKFM